MNDTVEVDGVPSSTTTEPLPAPAVSNHNSDTNTTSNNNDDLSKRGDVMVVAVNSINPDMIAIVALNDLPGNLNLYMTDNAWTGSTTLTNEGTHMLTLPSSGVLAGTVFGYGDNLRLGDEWQSVSVTFALAEKGDTVILFIEVNGTIQHLSAFSYAVVGWVVPDLSADQCDTAHSALPKSLTLVGAVSLPHHKNYQYIGPVGGKADFICGEIQKQLNWKGSEASQVEAPERFFQLNQPTGSSSGGRSVVPRSIWNFCVGCLFKHNLIVALL